MTEVVVQNASKGYMVDGQDHMATSQKSVVKQNSKIISCRSLGINTFNGLPKYYLEYLENRWSHLSIVSNLLHRNLDGQDLKTAVNQESSEC